MTKGNIILLVLAILTVIAGVIVFLEASAFQKKSKITEGTVIHVLGSSYKISYTSDDGNEHIIQGSSGKTTRYKEGQKKKVFYRADNPDKARITDGVKGGKNIMIIGAVVLVFSLYLIYLGRKKDKAVAYLKTNGRKTEAEIIAVEKDPSITVRKMNPYIVKCKWTDLATGKVYYHQESHVWHDPSSVLQGRKYFDVYIDRDNPGNYYIDCDILESVRSL